MVIVTKEENGYSVNGQHIDAQSALELKDFVERECYREDIVNQLESEYGEELTEKLPEELLNKIVDRYAENRGNSEDWLVCADEAIEKYESKIEAIQHSSPIEILADCLEQMMFERGEYDFAESDRIRWLDNIPEPYALADDPETLQEARDTVTKNIENTLNGGLQDISAIKDYLEDELAQMDEEDELVPKAKGYLEKVEGMEAVKRKALTQSEVQK